MVALEASILSADFARLGQQAQEAAAAGVDGIQVDVMDGRFVPNITFGAGVVRALRPLVAVTLDVHLMVVEPERHLAAFAEAGADRLSVHQEACPQLPRVLQAIRDLGVEAGVALNPETDLAVILDVLDQVDVVQVMTVRPGWGGQPFLSEQYDKIRRLRQVLDARGLDVAIAVDGGINPATAPLAVAAGATVLVAGAAIYNERASVAANVAALRASLRR